MGLTNQFLIMRRLLAAADRALGRIESGFTRSLAPCACRDGCGEPVVRVRAALANFWDLGLPHFPGQCRTALRAMGEAVSVGLPTRGPRCELGFH